MLLAVSRLVDGVGVFCWYWGHGEKGKKEGRLTLTLSCVHSCERFKSDTCNDAASRSGHSISVGRYHHGISHEGTPTALEGNLHGSLEVCSI